ncbi:MAG TPA: Hsp20/alpha crystallin family protein [Mycobacteriales bacterium]|nr:Hsp20/alpha crystallin family protein [Mycobacteriales bacterium]
MSANRMVTETHEPPDLVHRDPGEDLGLIGELLEREWRKRLNRRTPATQLEETDAEYVLELDLPGVDKKDIDVAITGRSVAIRGNRVEKRRTGLLRHTTRSTGSFAYEITLPTPFADNGVTAMLDKGVLTVRVPKRSDVKPIHIHIQ